MKIVIAIDSFKGSVSSTAAARAIEQGIQQVAADTEVIKIPMADGGEGTVEALITILNGRLETVAVEDPLGRPIQAPFGWVEAQRLAVIEVAAASGLPLLTAEELDPDRASSFGTGQLVQAALAKGARSIILGLGGSAMVDGGSGFLEALGIKFYDSTGRLLRGSGKTLSELARIDIEGLEPALQQVQITVASDVTNPLLGEQGAVHVFGPQKGVTAEKLERFEAGMSNYARLVQEVTGRDHTGDEGAGAAGGFGFALLSFLNVTIRNGFSLIAEMSHLRETIHDSDLVITGEGKLDSQSLFGKVPVGIARIAQEENVPAVAFAGKIEGDPAALRHEGLHAAVPIVDAPMTLQQAMADGEELLTRAGSRFMQTLQLGGLLSQRKRI